jgi:hypothetical protein
LLASVEGRCSDVVVVVVVEGLDFSLLLSGAVAAAHPSIALRQAK